MAHRHRSTREPTWQIMRAVIDYIDASRSYQTWVMAKQEEKLFIAMIKGKVDARLLIDSDPRVWRDLRIGPIRFRASSMWPRASSAYHIYSPSGNDDSLVYKKVKDPLEIVTLSENAYQNFTEDGMYKQISQREIEMCELLRRHPHPNIAKYKGVDCSSELVAPRDKFDLVWKFDTERVTTIVFKRYSSNLYDWVYAGKSVSLTDCLKDTVNGIKHMHAHGLVHCDIKPDNIFVDSGILRKTSYVVGDFDSTARRGSVYDLKGGTEGWSKKKRFFVDRVEEDDDWYSFEILKAWLIHKYGRRERDYDNIGGPRRGRR